MRSFSFPARTIVINEMALQIRPEHIITKTVLHDAVSVRQRLYFSFFRVKDPELPVSPDLIGMPFQMESQFFQIFREARLIQDHFPRRLFTQPGLFMRLV